MSVFADTLKISVLLIVASVKSRGIRVVVLKKKWVGFFQLQYKQVWKNLWEAKLPVSHKMLFASASVAWQNVQIVI